MLWNTTPDEELMAAAERGELETDAGLFAHGIDRDGRVSADPGELVGCVDEPGPPRGLRRGEASGDGRDVA